MSFLSFVIFWSNGLNNVEMEGIHPFGWMALISQRLGTQLFKKKEVEDGFSNEMKYWEFAAIYWKIYCIGIEYGIL